MTAPSPILDNLVIGGGLAGSMVAIRLAAAAAGLSLLEKERHAHHKVCGEFLSPEAVAYLHQLGVDPLTLGAATIRSVRLSAERKTVTDSLFLSAPSQSRAASSTQLCSRALRKHGSPFVAGSPSKNSSPQAEITSPAQHRRISPRTHSVSRHRQARPPRISPARPPGNPTSSDSNSTGNSLQPKPAPCEKSSSSSSSPADMAASHWSKMTSPISALSSAAPTCAISAAGPNCSSSIRHHNPAIHERLLCCNCRCGSGPWPSLLFPMDTWHRQSGALWCIGDQAAVIPSFTGDGMAIALHSCRPRRADAPRRPQFRRIIITVTQPTQPRHVPRNLALARNRHRPRPRPRAPRSLALPLGNALDRRFHPRPFARLRSPAPSCNLRARFLTRPHAIRFANSPGRTIPSLPYSGENVQ